jgi:hypothetical protein
VSPSFNIVKLQVADLFALSAASIRATRCSAWTSWRSLRFSPRLKIRCIISTKAADSFSAEAAFKTVIAGSKILLTMPPVRDSMAFSCSRLSLPRCPRTRLISPWRTDSKCCFQVARSVARRDSRLEYWSHYDSTVPTKTLASRS